MKSVALLYAAPSSDFSLDASGQDVSCRDSPVSVAALLRENAELRQTLASLQGLHDLAYHDALTGLWNRRYFEERMTEELARARRDPESPFTLVIVTSRFALAATSLRCSCPAPEPRTPPT